MEQFPSRESSLTLKKRETWFKLRMTVKIIFIACCVAGSVWACWGQLMKYVSKKTSVAVSFGNQEDFEMPLLGVLQ